MKTRQKKTEIKTDIQLLKNHSLFFAPFQTLEHHLIFHQVKYVVWLLSNHKQSTFKIYTTSHSLLKALARHKLLQPFISFVHECHCRWLLKVENGAKITQLKNWAKKERYDHKEIPQQWYHNKRIKCALFQMKCIQIIGLRARNEHIKSNRIFKNNYTVVYSTAICCYTKPTNIYGNCRCALHCTLYLFFSIFSSTQS